MDPFYLFFEILIFISGLYFTISDYYHSKYGFHTTGRVSKIVGRWRASGGTLSYLYFPLVQFKTEEGQDLELRLEVGASLPLYWEGQTVKIIYHQHKIHPTGTGWRIFNWTILLLGITTISYELFELANSSIWDRLGVIWQICQKILA